VIWRVGKNIPLNVYDGDRPVCQTHTAIDARRIAAAMNQYDSDDRDWKQIAEALGFGNPEKATREQIVEAARSLRARAK
jgi:hypothetical protein